MTVVTAKPIDPLAPAFNPKAFTDERRVEKWFRRNCKDVAQRECTPGEKADVLAWLDDAGAREQADLKLLEQEALGEKLRARHGGAPAKAKDPVDAKLDKALREDGQIFHIERICHPPIAGG